MFYLVRHGETDYRERNTKIYQGFGVNLAPLSPEGILQIKRTAEDTRLCGADIILSSPYTRALQTASILSERLHVDITVETDLHEWLADKHYIHISEEQAALNYSEFDWYGGDYPHRIEKDWETIPMLRRRVLAVLEKYTDLHKVIVVCHGMLIQSICNGYHPRNGEIIELDRNGMDSPWDL